MVRPASVLTRRGHDLGRLAVLTALAALALPATAAAASASLTVPAAHVRFTLEPDGVVDVLEVIELRAKGPFAARRELSMQQGELFADPSVVVNDRLLSAGDGRTPGTFRVSRGARGIRFDWRQPRGRGSVRLGYRLALVGTAYSDVVDLRVPVWEGDWPTGVDRLTTALRYPRPAHRRVFAWIEPDSLDSTVTKTTREVRTRTAAIPAGKRVTLRVVFPRDVLESVAGLKVEKKAGLASILAERNGGHGWWPWALGAALVLILGGVALRTVRSRRPRPR